VYYLNLNIVPFSCRYNRVLRKDSTSTDTYREKSINVSVWYPESEVLLYSLELVTWHCMMKHVYDFLSKKA
jgi:hypothetical protein